MSFLISHEWSLAVFMGVLAAIALSNLLFMKRLGRYPPLSKHPSVSILVPARDEERNIVTCVQSLLEQEYPKFEVIVLDDHSSDGTGDLLKGLVARSGGRLRVIHGKPLPAGWFGKHWACHQLAEAAQGEVLLFTDADTVHHPCALRDAVRALEDEQVGALSVLPRQAIGTWGERLVIPILPWVIHTFVPFLLTRGTSTAVGQFMLFRREAYVAIGGHVAARSEVLDDLALARTVHQVGLGWILLDGSSRVTTRMYRGWKETARGLAKNLFPVFRCNVLLFMFVWTWLMWLAWQPLFVLAFHAADSARYGPPGCGHDRPVPFHLGPIRSAVPVAPRSDLPLPDDDPPRLGDRGEVPRLAFWGPRDVEGEADPRPKRCALIGPTGRTGPASSP